MVRLVVAGLLAALLADVAGSGLAGGAAPATRGAAARPETLPAATFEDQDGRTLRLDTLRGRVVVLVYGGRTGIDHHVSWGRRLDAELRGRGVYRLEDPAEGRPVQILAVAQMGGIPGPFRGMLQRYLRQHVERGFSLWLDWEDLLSALFGTNEPVSTVVVADGAGAVRLIVAGLPTGPPYHAVSELLRSLL
jgi:hypothetical protein